MAHCSGTPGFSRRKILCSSTYTISEKTIRFWHPDYDPDRAQKLISSSTSRHLSTSNISSKSMHAFLSNLANRQTDRHGQKHVTPPLSEVTRVLGFLTWQRKPYNLMFICFDSIPAGDRQTDRYAALSYSMQSTAMLCHMSKNKANKESF